MSVAASNVCEWCGHDWNQSKAEGGCCLRHRQEVAGTLLELIEAAVSPTRVTVVDGEPSGSPGHGGDFYQRSGDDSVMDRWQCGVCQETYPGSMVIVAGSITCQNCMEGAS
ncbi:MAG: hypothetical protein OXH70_17375 [Acidobacteria bacterium]|nr:hypothetical protein [Acidobacteriota bacterium]